MDFNIRQLFQWQGEIIRYFWPYLRAERLFIALVFAVRVITVITNTLLIWMLGVAVSQITAAQFDRLNQTLLVIAGVVIFNQLIQFFASYTFQKLTLRFVDRVRGELLGRILSLSFPVLHKYEKGDLLARLTADVDRLLTFVVNVPLSLFTSLLVLLAYGSMLIWIDWRLSLIAATMAPIFYLSQHYVAPRTGRASRHFTEEKAELVSVEEQSLSNLRGISAFGGEQLVRDRHKRQFDVARMWALKVRKIRILYNTFFTFLLYAAAVIIVYSGISSIQAGTLSVGVLVSFLVYIRYLTGPVRNLARIPIQLHANRIAADRVMQIMRLEPDIQAITGQKPLQVERGGIEFRDVSFSYPRSSRPVFRHLTVTIEAGESIACVGPSGSGKSTLSNLLLRFYDPQSGTVTIDGVDIRTVSLESLRRQISVVWQEPFIMTGTVRENLLLAKPDATQEQIIEACKSSYAWEFIDKLEQSLETRIGAHGIELSAGQKQRLAIAQAFLRDSPILILDEASSALDSHSERMVVEALQSLREHRTTILIAHRYSSIRTADRILYFNGNGSVTVGTHEVLMAEHVHYKEAVNWQLA